MKIAVFCSARGGIDQRYLDVAEEVGELLGEQGHSLIYGGSNLSMMGKVASGVKKYGNEIVEVIPEKWVKLTNGGKIIHSKDLHERKRTLFELSDGFLALPGGIGTTSEITDLLDDISCEFVPRKPFVILNYQDFFDSLLGYFDSLKRGKFLHGEFNQFYFVTKNPKEAVEYLGKK